MSNRKKQIRNFVVLTVLVSIAIIISIRLFVLYKDESFDYFVNILYFVALFFLVVGFVNILIVNLKGEPKKERRDSDTHTYSYKNFFNITTLMVSIGIVLIVVNFFLALIISFENNIHS